MTKLEQAAKNYAEAEAWAMKCDAAERAAMEEVKAAQRRAYEAERLSEAACKARRQAIGLLQNAATEASR